jgi:hypothetical protein
MTLVREANAAAFPSFVSSVFFTGHVARSTGRFFLISWIVQSSIVFVIQFSSLYVTGVKGENKEANIPRPLRFLELPVIYHKHGATTHVLLPALPPLAQPSPYHAFRLHYCPNISRAKSGAKHGGL